MKHEVTNPMEAKQAAKEIRAALTNNCFNVYAVDIRDGREYRVTNVKLSKGTLLGQEPRMGVMFPIKSWEQR